MKLFLLFVLVFVLNSNAQIFEPVFFESNRERLVKGSFDVYETFQVDNYCFQIAIEKNSAQKDYGLLMLVFNFNGDLIFKSNSQADSSDFSLRFYRVPDDNKTIILGGIGNEYSWGNQVFELNKNTVKYIGLLDVAVVPNLAEEYYDIAPNTVIKKTDSGIKFSFDVEDLVHHPGGKNQEIIKAKSAYYFYDGGSLQFVKK